jgi:hypothetical protein
MIRRRAVRRRIRHERPGRPGAPPHHLPRLGRGQERLAQQDRTPRHDGRLGRGQVGHDPTGAGDGHLPGALLWLLCVSGLLCFSGPCVSRAAVCRCAVLLCDGAQLMEDHDKDGDGHLSLEVTPCARSCFRFPKSPRQVSIISEPISQVYHRSSRYFGEHPTPYAKRALVCRFPKSPPRRVGILYECLASATLVTGLLAWDISCLVGGFVPKASKPRREACGQCAHACRRSRTACVRKRQRAGRSERRMLTPPSGRAGGRQEFVHGEHY